jgi:hypothetical protein
MKILKNMVAISFLWWIVANVPGAYSGPLGLPVQLWFGPWDTEKICKENLEMGINGSSDGDPATKKQWQTATCRKGMPH